MIELALAKQAGRVVPPPTAPKSGQTRKGPDDFPDLSAPKKKTGTTAPIDTNDPWK
jgi:hypothetical protein